MQSIIQVEAEKGIYGRELYTPRNEQAKNVCKLLRQKFLSPSDIKILKGMGFTLETGIVVRGKFIEEAAL